MTSGDHIGCEPFPLCEDIQGPGVEWLARDARGHVALLRAVDRGDVSRRVLDELEAHRRALGAILHDPPTTRSIFDRRMENEGEGCWRPIVDRGLFVFTAHRSGGPYWITEAPLLPVRVADLPPLAAELLARLPATPLPFNHLASMMPECLGTE